MAKRWQNWGHSSAHALLYTLALALLAVAALAVSAGAQQANDSAAPAQATASSAAAPAVADPPDPPPADDSTESVLPHLTDSRFWLTGQANFIFQTHPDFRALYSGPHSLGPNYEKATSRVMTFYTGVRINNST